MKKMKLPEITRAEIYFLEDTIEQFCKNLNDKYKNLFEERNYRLLLNFSRNNKDPLLYPYYPVMEQKECFDLYYSSAITLYLHDVDGNWLSLEQDEDEDPFDIELVIWETKKKYFNLFCRSSINYYITELSVSDIKKILLDQIYYLAKKFNILLD